MALTSLQVCIDSSDWLQGTINEENGMDSSSPSGADILTCSRPLIERRLRPQHDQALKCPRCDSAHTKFCYYNNYSLSQPRYFCKTCRRYWTKGGTLRNIPVGGGCRKNKKLTNPKKSSSDNNHSSVISHVIPGPTSSTDLHLSFPEMQFSNLNNFLGSHVHNGNFMDSKYSNNPFLGANPRPIDFMENKFDQETISHNFMGNCENLGLMSNGLINDNFQTFNGNSSFNSTPYVMGLDGINNNYGGINLMDSCQRLMLPNYEDQSGNGIHEVKPNTKLLALEWQQDQSLCADGKDNIHQSFGYQNSGIGSWAGLMSGYGSSATNRLV